MLIVILFSASLISAMNLEISSKQVSDSVITGLDKPAIFDITIKNLGETEENLTIHSLVGVDILPKESFMMEGKTIKTKRVSLMPLESMNSKEGPITFEYIVKNSNNEIQKDSITINIMSLENVFTITPEPINPKSEKINIRIKNRATYDFDDLKLKMSSVFFSDYEKILPLKSLESGEIEIMLDKEKLKTIDAGHYLLKIQIETNGKTAKKDSLIKFLEQPNIETKETNEGIIIRRHEVFKKNLGNVKERITINSEKNLISYLFTTVSPLPTESEVKGFKKIYTWEKELLPDEELKVVVTTNWLYPILIVIFIIVIFIMIEKFIERDIYFRKNVSFVRTKGGQFALRIMLRVKSKKFIERINIIDKLPHLVNLYEKFGATQPDKIDLKNRRLEWNIESMNKGEERIFSYIIYSHKVGVVGKFELPSARAVYERDGKIKEATSNRAFFINELKKLQEPEKI